MIGTPARAQGLFMSGNKLFTACQTARVDDRSYCEGYASAIADVLANNAIHGMRACLSSTSVTVSQVTDIVTRFLREHPGVRDFAAEGLVAYALEGAFPCKS